ncbi:MAG: HEAT repeat domain-containing protein, partial [Anaerolineales bacterium]
MNSLPGLASLLNIRPGEGRLVSLLLAYSFFVGVARILTRSAAMSLFLVDFDAQSLPYVYIGISIVASLLAYAYLKLGQRLALSRLLVVTLAFLLVALVGFRIGVGLTRAGWLVFALPVWYEALWTLTSLAFWNLAGRLLNLRQGKRLFGLISAGESMAIVGSGFLVPLLVGLLGTPNLLLLAAGAIAAMLGILFYIAHVFRDQLDLPLEHASSRTKASVTGLLKNSYVRLICSLFGLIIFVYFFIDNIFYVQTQAHYHNEEALAGFIGVFFGSIGLISLLARLFLSGRLISRYGVAGGVLVAPIVLAAGVGLMALTETFSSYVVVLFWLAAATKLFSLVLLEATDHPVVNILYQPLQAARRTQVQTLVEGIIYPLAIGLAGLGLALFSVLLGPDSLGLKFVLLLVLAIWIATAMAMGRAYPKALREALVKRRLSGEVLSLEDGSSMDVLRQALHNPHPGVAVYALNTLKANAPERLSGMLPELLSHPAPEVRQEALGAIEWLDLSAALDSVKQTVRREKLPAVRAVALRVLAAIGRAEVMEEVYSYLEHPNVQIRLGAATGLLRHAEPDIAQRAEEKLSQYALSPISAERILAAEVCAEVPDYDMHQLLGRLLQDEDIKVRRVALAAAGKAKYPQLWPEVVDSVTSPDVRAAAAAGLVSGGDAALPAIEVAFARPDQERETLVRLAHVLGRIGGPQAEALLLTQLHHPHELV